VKLLDLEDDNQWVFRYLNMVWLLGVSVIGSRYFVVRSEVSLFILQHHAKKDQAQLREALNLHSDSIVIATNFGDTKRP